MNIAQCSFSLCKIILSGEIVTLLSVMAHIHSQTECKNFTTVLKTPPPPPTNPDCIHEYHAEVLRRTNRNIWRGGVN